MTNVKAYSEMALDKAIRTLPRETRSPLGEISLRGAVACSGTAETAASSVFFLLSLPTYPFKKELVAQRWNHLHSSARSVYRALYGRLDLPPGEVTKPTEKPESKFSWILSKKGVAIGGGLAAALTAGLLWYFYSEAIIHPPSQIPPPPEPLPEDICLPSDEPIFKGRVWEGTKRWLWEDWNSHSTIDLVRIPIVGATYFFIILDLVLINFQLKKILPLS